MKGYTIIGLMLVALIFASCKKDDDDKDFIGDLEGTKYKVTFNFNWSSTNFPTDYPSNAHLSPLVGWSHNNTVDFFKLGTKASTGIEIMAETGATGTLIEELEQKIENNEGLHAIVGSGLSSGTGEISVEMLVDGENTAITLSTMIAPSPDWYIAVVNIHLVENGKFVDSKVVDAYIYDAGTDDGTTYITADIDTEPRGTISKFVDEPLGNGSIVSPVIATVTFTKMASSATK